jgi:hypothetical protein
MACSKILPFDMPCKTPGIRIGPRLHLRLCAELLDLAHSHEEITRELHAVEARFEALLLLVSGARQ